VVFADSFHDRGREGAGVGVVVSESDYHDSGTGTLAERHGMALAGSRHEASRRFASVIEAHEARPTYFSDAELNGLFIRGYSPDTHRRIYSWTPTNTVNDGMMMDLENYMEGDILVKTDRASMANGLELRASFCISLPSTLKISKGQDKYILREAYGAAWTKTIRERGKQGFGAPVPMVAETVRAGPEARVSGQPAEQDIFDASIQRGPETRTKRQLPSLDAACIGAVDGMA